MTKKNERRALAREIRKATGLPLPVCGLAARSVVNGSFYSFRTGGVFPGGATGAALAAAFTVETYGCSEHSVCGFIGKFVGPRGVFQPG